MADEDIFPNESPHGHPIGSDSGGNNQQTNIETTHGEHEEWRYDLNTAIIDDGDIGSALGEIIHNSNLWQDPTHDNPETIPSLTDSTISGIAIIIADHASEPGNEPPHDNESLDVPRIYEELNALLKDRGDKGAHNEEHEGAEGPDDDMNHRVATAIIRELGEENARRLAGALYLTMLFKHNTDTPTTEISDQRIKKSKKMLVSMREELRKDLDSNELEDFIGKIKETLGPIGYSQFLAKLDSQKTRPPGFGM